jgi:hypothetical protein
MVSSAQHWWGEHGHTQPYKFPQRSDLSTQNPPEHVFAALQVWEGRCREAPPYPDQRIKCGAPHLMRESGLSGSLRGVPNNGHPDPGP